MADLGLTLESVREAITENLALTNRLRELWHLAKEWLHFIITLCFVAYLVARREQRRYARRLRAAATEATVAAESRVPCGVQHPIARLSDLYMLSNHHACSVKPTPWTCSLSNVPLMVEAPS